MTVLPLVALLLSGCASSRLLRVENTLLQQEVDTLQETVDTLRLQALPEDDYVRRPALSDVHRFLDDSGYSHVLADDGSHIRLEYGGDTTDFAVTLQLFERPGVLFLSTKNYLRLGEAEGTESVVLLLVRLATLNYEMLLGKFQLNGETGEVLLSAEIHLQDGLSRQKLVRILDHLCTTADKHYPTLSSAVSGNGM